MNTIDFLKSWCGDTGPFSIGSIDPEDTSSHGHDWLTTRDLDEVQRFIDDHATRGRNLYFQVNLCRPDLGTMRAHRGNVAVAVCVHAEIDPPKTTDTIEKLEIWQSETGGELISEDYWPRIGLPYPTAVMFSGTGFVVMWKLEEPVVMWRGEPLAQDPFLVDAIESRNRALVDKLGADPMSTDVSRLLRLPGTYNIPGESKKKKGRTEAVLAELVEYEPTRTVALAMMPASAPQIANSDVEIPEFEGAPPPEAIEAAAQVLGKAWVPDGTKHQAHLALAGSLARVGWPVELIASFAARVAEIDKPGNAKMDRRMKAAETSVAKVRSGQIITGWPSLIEHVGEEVVTQIREILDLPAPVEHDPEFTAALVEADPPTPEELPMRGLVRAALKSAAQKLQRKTKPEDKYAGELIGRVLRNERVVREDEDPKRGLVEAAQAVIRYAPDGTTDAQLTEVLLGSVSLMGFKSDIGDLIKGSRGLVERSRVAEVSRRLPDEFILADSGPRAGLPVSAEEHNVRVALKKLGVTYRYNLFADQELISKDDTEEEVQDHHIKILRNEFQRRYRILFEKDFLFDTCEVIARENSFHPVLEYLDALPTEIPDEYLDFAETWLIRFAGAEDTPYVREVSRLFLVAAVRRVRDPGCLFQEMVILESAQGKGKSEGLRALVPNGEWFLDDFALHTDDSKRMLEQTDGKWIIEAAELKGFLSTSDDSVKQYLSRREDRARMSYGRKTRLKKRQFVMIGTINDLEYLKDLTGNRRYWPVRIKEFKVEALREARDVIWAVASYLEQQHPEPEYIRLDPSLYAVATEEQEKRRMVSPTENTLREMLEGITGALQVSDLYKVLFDDKRPNKTQNQEVVAVLQALGFTRERTARVDGKQKWWYMAGDTDAQRHVRINITGSAITGFEVKLSQVVSGGVSKPPHAPEAPGN